MTQQKENPVDMAKNILKQMKDLNYEVLHLRKKMERIVEGLEK